MVLLILTIRAIILFLLPIVVSIYTSISRFSSSLCTDVPPPSESLLPIFPEGGGGVCTQATFRAATEKKIQLNCVKEVNRSNNEVQKS